MRFKAFSVLIVTFILKSALQKIYIFFLSYFQVQIQYLFLLIRTHFLEMQNELRY